MVQLNTAVQIGCFQNQVEVGLDRWMYIWREVGEEWHPACTAPPPERSWRYALMM